MFSAYLYITAANQVPNVLLCIPLDHICEAERGILATGHPRVLILATPSAPCPGKRTGEDTSMLLLVAAAKTTRETAVTSYKP